MNASELIAIFGPVGAVAFLGIAALKVVWPTLLKQFERRTAAAEKQAAAFTQIADLTQQTFARLGAMELLMHDNRADLIGIYERMQQPRPSRRKAAAKLVLPEGSS